MNNEIEPTFISDLLLVNTTTVVSQYSPHILLEEGGEFIIVWQSNHGFREGDYQSHLFFQRYDAAGNKIGPETSIWSNSYSGWHAVGRDASGNLLMCADAPSTPITFRFTDNGVEQVFQRIEPFHSADTFFFDADYFAIVGLQNDGNLAAIVQDVAGVETDINVFYAPIDIEGRSEGLFQVSSYQSGDKIIVLAHESSSLPDNSDRHVDLVVISVEIAEDGSSVEFVKHIDPRDIGGGMKLLILRLPGWSLWRREGTLSFTRIGFS